MGKRRSTERLREIEEACRLRRAGLSYRAIAKVFGVSYAAIQNWTTGVEKGTPPGEGKTARVAVNLLDWLIRDCRHRYDKGDEEAGQVLSVLVGTQHSLVEIVCERREQDEALEHQRAMS